MKITKSMLAAGAVTTVAVASLTGLGVASAHSSNNGNGNGLVDRVATTFGLNKDEVQTVFDEQKTEMHEQMEQNREQHLQSLVDDGTLTEDQKAALDAKHEEFEAAREAIKDQDISREEMHEQMEQAREEFKSWTESQGIDLEAIHPEDGPGRGRGHMMKGFNQTNQ